METEELENVIFTFWRENKVVNEFTVTGNEFKNGFKTWLEKQDKVLVEYMHGDALVLKFITDQDGLNSVFDNELETIKNLYSLAKPIIREVVSAWV